MYYSKIGKLEARAIITEFEKTLIDEYGMNMRDASLTREDAINAFNDTGCPIKAAEQCATRLGLKPKSANT